MARDALRAACPAVPLLASRGASVDFAATARALACQRWLGRGAGDLSRALDRERERLGCTLGAPCAALQALREWTSRPLPRAWTVPQP